MDGKYNIGDIVLDKWTLTENIGTGLVGRVFRAEREDFGHIHIAAIKIITISQSTPWVISETKEMSNDEAQVFCKTCADVLERELGLVSKLRGNRNIIGYEEVKVETHSDGVSRDIIIRMELCTSLSSHIQSNNMTEKDIAELGVNIGKALELSRMYSIIHGNIKPNNIFVAENGEYRLGDFGIAVSLESVCKKIKRADAGKYLAPEVLNEEDYGPCVDSYSLGLVLYELLNNNCLPFFVQPSEDLSESDAEHAIKRRILGETLPEPMHGSNDFAKLILKATSFSPQDRYAGVLQMRMELETIMRNPATMPAPAPQINQRIVNEADAAKETTSQTERLITDISQPEIEQPEIIQPEIEQPNPVIKQSEENREQFRQVKTEVPVRAFGERGTERPGQSAQRWSMTGIYGDSPEKSTQNKDSGITKRAVVAVLASLAFVVIIIVTVMGINNQNRISDIYFEADALFSDGRYMEARDIFLTIVPHRNTEHRIAETYYNYAHFKLLGNQFEEAIEIFKSLEQFREAQQMIDTAKYQYARYLLFYAEDFLAANALLKEIYPYGESSELIYESYYRHARGLLNTGDFAETRRAVQQIYNHDRAQNLLTETDYMEAMHLIDTGYPFEARDILENISDFKNSADLIREINYNEAIELMEEGNLYYAYLLFVEAEGFGDSHKYVQELLYIFYETAVESYREGDFDFAESLFVYTRHIGDSDNYLILLRARRGLLTSDGRILIALMEEGFEDVIEVVNTYVIQNDEFFRRFLGNIPAWDLRREWRTANGQHSIRFFTQDGRSGWHSSTLPRPAEGSHRIRNARHYFGTADTGFAFGWGYQIVSVNEIIVNHFDGRTFTFHRR